MEAITATVGTETSATMIPNYVDNKPATRRDVMGVILSITACLIISTNLLVAAALLKLLLKKSSQSWCFVLNLALADALVGGKTRCLMRMAFVASPCTASIMSMFLISLDRYAAIKMPLRYSLLSGKGTAAVSLLALWISSLAVGFLPVMVQQLQTEGYSGFCAFFSVIQEVGIIILFSACFFPVLSVFIYIYLDILRIACSHQKQISQVRQAGSRTADDHGHQHYQHHHQLLQLRSGYWSHVKALKMVAVLVGCFSVLWCPFFVVCIVHILCKSCELTGVLENYLWLLGLTNSLINPIVYAFCQKEVRLQLAAMFSCFKHGCSLTSGPPDVKDSDLQPPVLTQSCVSGGDALNPSKSQPITCNDESHTVPLSATTSM
ncbi:glucose-dependent insulinotropic receptor isoform X2 [Anabas testudineus]|uniref:glucose-dependent insulinotropic receptor isoform X2 n=1 Tax=Anabas testudineus TaxID=64144 RepID=UPI000E464F52|nr:glucose-dependent insulinotropic receptor isoform X2 [Anabas testudineus]